MISRGNSRYMLQEFSSTSSAIEVKKIVNNPNASTTSTGTSSPTTDQRPIRVSPSGKVAHEFGIVDQTILRKPSKLPSIAPQNPNDGIVLVPTKQGF